MSEFSDRSKTITASLTKTEKKKNGIFFTPYSIVDKILSDLPPDFSGSILEPSCGSGQFLDKISEKWDGDVKIVAIEKNEKIVGENNDIINEDFLEWDAGDQKFDLIIGNPPYYVMKQSEISSKYVKRIKGRPNIFALFILKSMDLLAENGKIIFVLPSSFLNSSYYMLVRKQIIEQYGDLGIKVEQVDGKFQETKQIVYVMTIGKDASPEKCWLSFSSGEKIVFNTVGAIKELTVLSSDSTTLEKLGANLKIGACVWNQHKEFLTDDSEAGHRLIYESDIQSDHTIGMKEFKNEEKKHYIDTEKLLKDKGKKLTPLSGRNILINRGSGNSSYKMKYAVVDMKESYVVENHIIVVSVSDDYFDDVVASFADDRTNKFITKYTGNGGITKGEMMFAVPIFAKVDETKIKTKAESPISKTKDVDVSKSGSRKKIKDELEDQMKEKFSEILKSSEENIEEYVIWNGEKIYAYFSESVNIKSTKSRNEKLGIYVEKCIGLALSGQIPETWTNVSQTWRDISDIPKKLTDMDYNMVGDVIMKGGKGCSHDIEIEVKEGENLLIEVKNTQRASSILDLPQIRDVFDKKGDDRFFSIRLIDHVWPFLCEALDNYDIKHSEEFRDEYKDVCSGIGSVKHPIMKLLKEKHKKWKAENKKSTKKLPDYLSELNKRFISSFLEKARLRFKNIETSIKEALDGKIYIIGRREDKFSTERFIIDTLKNDDISLSDKTIISKNKIEILSKSGDFKYILSIHWKNGTMLKNPYFKLKVKRN